MLETVRGLGYTGIELVPPWYFGDDAEGVARLLERYDLERVGAFASRTVGGVVLENSSQRSSSQVSGGPNAKTEATTAKTSGMVNSRSIGRPRT